MSSFLYSQIMHQILLKILSNDKKDKENLSLGAPGPGFAPGAVTEVCTESLLTNIKEEPGLSTFVNSVEPRSPLVPEVWFILQDG